MFDFLYWFYAAFIVFVQSDFFSYFFYILISFSSLSAVVFLIKYILRGT